MLLKWLKHPALDPNLKAPEGSNAELYNLFVMIDFLRYLATMSGIIAQLTPEIFTRNKHGLYYISDLNSLIWLNSYESSWHGWFGELTKYHALEIWESKTYSALSGLWSLGVVMADLWPDHIPQPWIRTNDLATFRKDLASISASESFRIEQSEEAPNPDLAWMQIKLMKPHAWDRESFRSLLSDSIFEGFKPIRTSDPIFPWPLIRASVPDSLHQELQNLIVDYPPEIKIQAHHQLMILVDIDALDPIENAIRLTTRNSQKYAQFYNPSLLARNLKLINVKWIFEDLIFDSEIYRGSESDFYNLVLRKVQETTRDGEIISIYPLPDK